MEHSQPTSEERPDIHYYGPYSNRVKIQIRGEFNYIKSKIEKYWTKSGFYPGFDIKDLGNGIYNITDAEPDSEPQYIIAKKIPFRERKQHEEYSTYEVKHFYLKIISKTKFARMKVTDADLTDGTQIFLHHILKKDTAQLKGNEVRYEVQVEILNSKRRNVASELITILSGLAEKHLEYIESKFTSKLSKIANSIESVFRPNGGTNILTPIQKQLENFLAIKAKLENGYEAFIKPNNNDKIQYLDYGLPGLRLFKYADQVGRGFSLRSDIQILRSVFLQLGTSIDFIKKSADADDQFHLPFVPKGEKFSIVKEVALNWYKDEYFCFELFNGCNPFTIKVAEVEKLRQEFKELYDEHDQLIDLSKFERGDLFISQYPELRKFATPNYEHASTRGLYFREPEVLSAIVDGKHVPLAIGFYFGPDGTDFEVFTPSGRWREHKTPKNLWILAKMHALCADSQTHEVLKHLGMSHMIGETFAISHHNAYNHLTNEKGVQGNTVVGDMLAPHFVNLIGINNLARVTLIAPLSNSLSLFQGVRGEDFAELIARWYTERSDIWNVEVGFYEEARNRGFDPNTFKHGHKYRYLRDGKIIYDHIHKYVQKVISAQYPTDESVRNDKLLNAFFDGIASEKKGDIRGFPKTPNTVHTVIETLTKIIWQVSGYHSALNFSQVQSYNYSAFRPPGLRQPLPKLSTYRQDLSIKDKGWLTEDDVSIKYIHETQPTNAQIFGMTEIANVLTTRTVQTFNDWSSPFTRARHDVEANIASHQAHTEFVAEMKQVQESFTRDNETSQFRYIHLLPSNIDISLSI
ncbi:arachidonate 15-lipoxygenase [Stylonychia lemnae]|uniref:Arachidonate 15-lipoxygenase n=1 Tax=Stylonychia lemnae TaxID=5949 RepID=A0A078APJ4_STYLE|nr:arachidonate 15-lipoxygenase [Stylonychia lemnae]|eukprot:CDW84295.1 arachidonate 15-lipoxygenase [Stylonychia lemnae]